MHTSTHTGVHACTKWTLCTFPDYIHLYSYALCNNIMMNTPVGWEEHTSIRKESSGGWANADKAGTAAEGAKIARPGGMVVKFL